MKFGDRLKRVLATEDIKQADFAKAASMDTAHLSHILSNHRDPSFPVLQRMLLALPSNVDIGWLLIGDTP